VSSGFYGMPDAIIRRTDRTGEDSLKGSGDKGAEGKGGEKKLYF